MLKHVLTPRMKASHVAIDAMKDHLDAVYDITVAYEGTLTADGQRRPAPSMPGTLVMFLSQIFVWPTENCTGKNAGTGCVRPAIIQTCEFADTSCKQATRATRYFPLVTVPKNMKSASVVMQKTSCFSQE